MKNRMKETDEYADDGMELEERWWKKELWDDQAQPSSSQGDDRRMHHEKQKSRKTRSRSRSWPKPILEFYLIYIRLRYDHEHMMIMMMMRRWFLVHYIQAYLSCEEKNYLSVCSWFCSILFGLSCLMSCLCLVGTCCLFICLLSQFFHLSFYIYILCPSLHPVCYSQRTYSYHNVSYSIVTIPSHPNHA